MSLDWFSRETHLLLNPRMPPAERTRLESIVRDLPPLEGHVWIATSGTTGTIKLASLAKTAMLASAGAVNRHLQATSQDVWACVLPDFHVGGLGIHARAALSHSRVLTMEWDPSLFTAQTTVTLSSLVPAQVVDLVQAGLRAPAAMRAIVVGGGPMPPGLYEEARALGWPVLPSYGLTEACSQVATALRDSPELRVLTHVEVRIVDGKIALRGPSLLTGYGLVGEDGLAAFVDPKVDGWLQTEDRGLLRGDVLEVFGREGEFVKIGGESVDLRRLDAILDRVRGRVDAAVVAVPDERLGSVIHLAATDEVARIRSEFDRQVHPFERARRAHAVERIPRTALGKLMRSELVGLIGGKTPESEE
jgi:o-succinylbenzoate---CoA ligase